MRQIVLETWVVEHNNVVKHYRFCYDPNWGFADVLFGESLMTVIPLE